MSAPTAKRARADTAGTVLVSNGRLNLETTQDLPSASPSVPTVAASFVNLETVTAMLAELPTAWTRDALASMALKHPDILQAISDEVKRTRDRANKLVIDFDHYSKSIWKELNVTYRSMSGSRQYDIANDVADRINSTIKSIVTQCQRPSSPQTRRNGLEVLRKIGKSIVLSHDTLGHEVQNRYQWDKALEDGMLEILEYMDRSELDKIRGGTTSPSELWQKLLELETLARSACCFEAMHEVIEYIDGSDSEDPNDEEYESHGADEEDGADELDDDNTEAKEESGENENH
ncbi:hypothetical protein V8E54_007165 [Elaphomyces granulatus]|jgi:hypothetical protein